MTRVLAVLLFYTASLHAATVTVTIDLDQNRRAINPEIYGANFAESSQLNDPGFTVQRWGGNSTSRYNWQADVHNTAADYFYQNIPDGNGSNLPDNSTTNQYIETALDNGSAPILTIGMTGWTPDPERNKKWSFSILAYGEQTLDECRFYEPNPPPWCIADSGNGECDPSENTTGFCVNNRIVGNNPDDTSFATGADYAGNWLQHLVQRHGAAGNGGIRYYALGNEPMLWNSTHRDVHPEPATYDETWQKAIDYGSAIKQVDPGARVFGPVTWGYCDLFGSAADNCQDGADRQAHGGVAYVQWYLRQVCEYEANTGIRLVDYLDLHYYPQGVGIVDFGGNNLGFSESEEVAARRLRSLKELYDPDWVSESWLGDLGDFDENHYDKPQLIPRVRAWIDSECPDMKLAITEYNWGPDQGVSAALAQAEALAIFGREGVDLATRWTAPTPGSMVEKAFRLYLNYDGAGRRVIGDSVHAISADVNTLGAYAVDLPGERTMVLLFNKAITATTAEINLSQQFNGDWTLYRYSETTDVTVVASGTVNAANLTLTDLPPRSASLLVLPAGDDSESIFINGFE